MFYFKIDDHVKNDDSIVNNESDEDLEEGLAQSEDFPGFFQSQNQPILQCEVCDFETRDKSEYENHCKGHPKCDLCQTSLENIDTHFQSEHSQETVQCSTCNEDVPLQKYKDMSKLIKLLQVSRVYR